MSISEAPAPWTCKATAYWLFLWLPKELHQGIYDPLEGSSAEFADQERSGKFTGGLGMIQVLRYSTTPVGPYDELLIIPGSFHTPSPVNANRLRITRIYVSQRTTTFNGRRNWNIPKHLARFEFSPPGKDVHVAVYPPKSEGGDGTKPFFEATLTPWRGFGLPFSTKWSPLSTIAAQPPLPAATSESVPSDRSSPAETSGRREQQYGVSAQDADVLVGTSQWAEMPLHAYTPRARLMSVQMHNPKEASAEEVEAQNWWPIKAQPYRIGMVLEEAVFEIPKPKQWAP